ncbi:Peroxidase 42 [Dichanthelium oligosanthes]|uniref:Peroxidase n=1 Tax=Dichanthelium oligosanthes TaxID=888268 RepID=A0A1E5VVP8_9POAL|nr:Peroxidase 42 [Dichanthelium oligosanthes]
MAAASNFLGLLVLVVLASAASAQLSPTFYDTSCPRALATIRSGVNAAVAQEARMGASLLRLHFHDCFVRAIVSLLQNTSSMLAHLCRGKAHRHMQYKQIIIRNLYTSVQGCDASILLNETTGERFSPPNMNSVRGYEVIDSIKAQVEAVCPQTVSCADILAVAARDSVVALGGPSWTVLLGRRDSTNSFPGQTTDLPAPTLSLQGLRDSFNKKSLDLTDLVALSGAHTIGQAQCLNFRDHITEPNINPAFAASLRANCPATGGDTNLSPLDATTPTIFDNAYYSNLVSQRGLLHSDQQLFNNGSADGMVTSFASSAAAFTSAFTTAMVKMGNLQPLTGTNGQIRLNCWRVN